MAERTPPSWLSGGSHSAENDRLGLGVTILTSGLRDATDLAVTAPGGTMTVSVAAGQALIVGSRANQGMYHVVNDAALTKTIAAADPTNPRYDRVVFEVKDAFYAGGVNAAQINVYQGTPSGSPAEPAIPADAIELARITVPAAATSIVTGNILDRRAQAVRRATIFAGLTTTGPMVVGGVDLTTGWTAYTPSVSGSGSALGNGTLSGAYKQVGKIVHFRAQFNLGSTSTVGTSLILALPVTVNGVSQAAAGSALHSATNYQIGGFINAGSALITATCSSGFVTSTAPFTWANGDQINICGTYEAA